MLTYRPFLFQLLFHYFSLFFNLLLSVFHTACFSPSPLTVSERDLWSKIRCKALPSDWQKIHSALWAAVRMAADQYLLWLPVSIYPRTHTSAHVLHAQTSTCEASIKACPRWLPFTRTGPGCLQRSRRQHSRDSSHLREAGWLLDDGASEICSQIPAAPLGGYIRQFGQTKRLTEHSNKQRKQSKEQRPCIYPAVCVVISIWNLMALWKLIIGSININRKKIDILFLKISIHINISNRGSWI